LNCLNWLQARSAFSTTSQTSEGSRIRLQELDIPLTEDEVSAVIARLIELIFNYADDGLRQWIESKIRQYLGEREDWRHRQEFGDWLVELHDEPIAIRRVVWDELSTAELGLMNAFRAVLGESSQEALELGGQVDQQTRRRRIDTLSAYWDHALVDPAKYSNDRISIGRLQGRLRSLGIPEGEIRSIIAADNHVDLSSLDGMVRAVLDCAGDIASVEVDQDQGELAVAATAESTSLRSRHADHGRNTEIAENPQRHSLGAPETDLRLRVSSDGCIISRDGFDGIAIDLSRPQKHFSHDARSRRGPIDGSGDAAAIHLR
jgi:hypothetical protein